MLRIYVTLSLAAVILLVAVPLAAQPSRQELLAEPQYADSDRRPAYRSVTATELEKAISVRPGIIDDFGEQRQTIDISLPKGDNGLHTIALVSIPEVRDGSGETIEASGFRTAFDAGEGLLRVHYLGDPADAARVVSVKGRARIRYPLAVTTHSIKAGDKGSREKHGIEIDGPYIRYEGNGLRPQRWGGSAELIRAYDATGRRLKQAGEWVDDEERMYIAAYGKVARVDFDVPGELAAALIEYELSPQQPDAPAKVTVRRLPSLPLAVLGETATLEEHHMLGYLEGFTGSLDEQLFRAVTEDDPKAVRYLLALGADPNARGTSGSSPFGIAALMNRAEVAELLIDSGADVKSKDDDGVAPLLRMVPNCPPASLIAKMIARGADPNVEGFNGINALKLAKAMQCQEVVAVLEKAGAK